MTLVALPTQNFYVSVNEKVLEWAMTRIEEQFRDLLENGTQAGGMPEGVYAAGQHLNPYSLNQRGFYGTSAALLVMSRTRPSPNRIGIIEGLIKYVADRETIERVVLSTAEDLAMLPTRLFLDWHTVFKCTDLLYALAAAPAAVAGREALLKVVLDKLLAARREGGGWAVDLDPAHDRDALATASVVRSLHAAGVAVQRADLDLVRNDAAEQGNVSPYVRCFCLLVMAEIGDSDDKALTIWRELFDILRHELHERTEANYEFVIRNRQYYVRVPWQLYLIASTAHCKPGSLIFAQDIRRALLDCLQAVDSPEGYVYTAFGHMKSTRTYGILMDTLWIVRSRLHTTRVLSRLSLMANWTIRFVYARPSMWLALAAALSLAGFGLYAWINGSAGRVAEVGPELAAAVLLGIISFLLSRVRSRRR